MVYFRPHTPRDGIRRHLKASSQEPGGEPIVGAALFKAIDKKSGGEYTAMREREATAKKQHQREQRDSKRAAQSAEHERRKPLEEIIQHAQQNGCAVRLEFQDAKAILCFEAQLDHTSFVIAYFRDTLKIAQAGHYQLSAQINRVPR